MKPRELSRSLRSTRRRVFEWVPRQHSLTCVALLFAPLVMLAQNDKQVWVQRFCTTYGSSESAYSIARDSAGNAIVAGDSNEGGLGLGILVIKYSARAKVCGPIVTTFPAMTMRRRWPWTATTTSS